MATADGSAEWRVCRLWPHLPGGRPLAGIAVHALLYEGHDLGGAVLGGLNRVQLAPRGRVLGDDLPQQHRERKGVDLHASESFMAAASLTAAQTTGLTKARTKQDLSHTGNH